MKDTGAEKSIVCRMIERGKGMAPEEIRKVMGLAIIITIPHSSIDRTLTSREGIKIIEVIQGMMKGQSTSPINSKTDYPSLNANSIGISDREVEAPIRQNSGQEEAGNGEEKEAEDEEEAEAEADPIKRFQLKKLRRSQPVKWRWRKAKASQR